MEPVKPVTTPVESAHRQAEELVECLVDHGPATRQELMKWLGWSEGRFSTALAYARTNICEAMGMAIPTPTPGEGWRYEVTCDWLPVQRGASYSLGVIESRLRGIHRDVRIVLPHIDKEADLLEWRRANFLNKHLEHLLRTLAEINGTTRRT